MQGNIFEEAKKVDLLDYLERTLGVTPRFSSGWARFSSCVACGEGAASSVRLSAKDGYWHCYSCGGKGDIIDAVVAYRKVSKMDAAKILTGADAGGASRSSAPAQRPARNLIAQREQREELAKVIVRLKDILGSTEDSSVMEYLTRQRRLPAGIVQEAQRRGLLAMLPGEPHRCVKFLEQHFGKDQLVAAGLWREDAKWPKIAGRPLIFFLSDDRAAEFRLIRAPRDSTEIKSIRFGETTKPWLWRGNPERVSIVEGAIDMLSMVALGYSGTVIGLPGCNQWKDEYLVDAVKAKASTVVLDNDAPGQKHAVLLLQRLAELGANARNKLTPQGKDVNDYLRLMAA